MKAKAKNQIYVEMAAKDTELNQLQIKNASLSTELAQIQALGKIAKKKKYLREENKRLKAAITAAEG
jgi:hypothetical protein